ncbi:AMP-dependent synthetase [Loktanella sp. 3ANDIMAR09]|uniref:AMP-binding protein n=1 Tax=Loktanella sp. 3ANDIMAR09 TaxID=1225657 RepID=UPI0006F1CC42|nr:AMP-binding protein [Loktanella sp. 3ANDIMAR09]KQI68650.1 AMP-dependent synthetase [Loktanella sp. 3ANDIMAR09]
MLIQKSDYARTRAAFRWDIPRHYNIGVDCCDRIADLRTDATAIIDASGVNPRTVTFGQLRSLSNQMARLLSRHAGAGSRIGVLLPQSVETAMTHLAAFKLGAISLPLFTLFGPDALRHRLRDSGACVVVTDAAGAAKIDTIRADLPDLACVIVIGADLDATLSGLSDDFPPARTAADDPALLIYTSGTTGPPKGALHAHRVLLGHLPGVEMSHDFLPQPGDRIWTPADWAWIGGLLDVLLPALHHGIPVVACRFAKFTAEAAFALMRDHGVRNAFLPPTALKIMRLMPDPPQLNLRSVASGGETLGTELIDWGQRVLGCTINEFYGQTECNMIVSSCAALAPAVPGVMGFAVPGHDVQVINADGQPCAVGAEGDIACRGPDPVMFLRYWNNPAATKAKMRGDWLLTGDRGMSCTDGRIRFKGRDDDIISSGGYRIGPAEIEDCLLTHPAVQMAGVVGAPDPVRGEMIVAFVQLVPGAAGDDALASTLSAHVRHRLAAHEAPRRIIFADSLPLTTTGKIIRADLRVQLAQG